MKQPIIAVCGAGDAAAASLQLAHEVGSRIAAAGAIMICGGHGGVMQAACAGAKAAGGLTIGVLPGTDRHAANPFVDIPIVTGMGQARNLIIVGTAQAVIAIGGEYGTLSEIALALKIGVPVVGLHTWQLAKAAQQVADPIVRAGSAVEAVRLAMELARGSMLPLAT